MTVSDKVSLVTCQSKPPTVLIGLEHLFALLQFLVTGLKCFLQLPYLHYMYRWGDTLSTGGGHEEMYVHTNKGYIYTYIYIVIQATHVTTGTVRETALAK